MSNSWVTRGRKPDRNVEAALVGGGLAYLQAVLDGKPRPWLHAVSHAVGSGLAMDEHRIIDRQRANERNTKVAEQLADAANRLIDTAETTPCLPALEADSESPTYLHIMSGWRQFVAATGRFPGLVDLALEDWQALSPRERDGLSEMCWSHAVPLRVAGLDFVYQDRLLTR